MSAIAYLKAQCGWSRGVREVLAKYNIEYEERQIHDPVNFQEMVEKTGQTNQPCVQLNEEFISFGDILVIFFGNKLQISLNFPLLWVPMIILSIFFIKHWNFGIF